MRLVNVASVPQRSPFRYPGGKTWLVPTIRKWLRSRPTYPALFLEPFAGGAIASLTVAFERLAGQIIMSELDHDVSVVWKTILGKDARWLANRMVNFDMSVETVKEIILANPRSEREKAFRTIIRNRVLHGGILAAGSSLIKHGENGKGVHSRWYPQTLSQRILDISDLQRETPCITFYECDGLAMINEHKANTNCVFFLDPPYTAAGKKAGKRLYTHHDLDHHRLFSLASELKGDFLMTYDHADGVLDFARQFQFDTEVVAMKNTHHAKMNELIISRDLSWLRRGYRQNQLFS